MGKRKMEKTAGWQRGSVLVLALLFSVMQVLGCLLSLENHTTVHIRLAEWLQGLSAWGWVLLGVLETIGYYVFFQWLLKKLGKVRKGESPSWKGRQKISFVLLAAVGLLLCWLPVLLSNLPGFYNYDISGQVIQVMYPELNSYNTHHSLLSTLVMGGIITWGYRVFGTLSAGVFVYSCFQMCLCALTFAYSLYFIYQKTCRRALVGIGFFFYGFSPTIAMFSMSTTKDVLCSLCALLTSLLVFAMLEEEEAFFQGWRRPAALLVCGILASLFRKNIIYAVIVFAVICVLLAKERKKVLFLFAGMIAGFFLASAALEGVLEAEKGGAAEVYSIPLQQIGYLCHTVGEEAFTAEEQAFLEKLADRSTWENYSPFIADNIKNSMHTDFFEEHKAEFLLLWAKKGLQYPGKYIRAFGNLTYQAWYPGTVVSQEEIYYFDFVGINFPLEKTSYFPALTEFYRKISLEFFYQRVPVVRLLFSTGFMLWVLLLALLRGVYEKQKMTVGMTLFAACICLTCLAGPVSLVRYYLILFYGFPVYLAILFYQKKTAMHTLADIPA